MRSVKSRPEQPEQWPPAAAARLSRPGRARAGRPPPTLPGNFFFYKLRQLEPIHMYISLVMCACVYYDVVRALVRVRVACRVRSPLVRAD